MYFPKMFKIFSIEDRFAKFYEDHVEPIVEFFSNSYARLKDYSLATAQLYEDLSHLLRYMSLSDKLILLAVTVFWLFLVVYKSTFMLEYYTAQQIAISTANAAALLDASFRIQALNMIMRILQSLCAFVVDRIMLFWHQNINHKMFEVFGDMSALYNSKFDGGVAYTMGTYLLNTFTNLFTQLFVLSMQLTDLWTSVVFLSTLSPQIFLRVSMLLGVVFCLNVVFQHYLSEAQKKILEKNQLYSEKTNQYFDRNNSLTLISHSKDASKIKDQLSGIQSAFTSEIMNFTMVIKVFENVASFVDSVEDYCVNSYLLAMTVLGKIGFNNALSVTARVRGAYFEFGQVMSIILSLPNQLPAIHSAKEHIRTCEKSLEIKQQKFEKPDNDDVIVIDNLSLSYRAEENKDHTELWQISDLSIKKSDRVLVKGASGRGKSSFLLILAGIITNQKMSSIYYDGELKVSSDMIRFRSQDNVVPLGIGAADNVTCNKWFAWPEPEMSCNDDKEKARGYLEAMFKPDESITMDKPLPQQLSGGQRRRLNAFQPLLGEEDKFLLVDEITNDMGSDNAEKYLDFIEADTSVKGYVLSSHIAHEASHFTKIITFNDDRTVTVTNNVDFRQQSGP